MRKFEYVQRYNNIEPDFELPKRSTKNSAGYDFVACEDTIVGLFLRGAKPTLVRTGVKVKMFDNDVLLLANRSSNPFKKGLALANGVGVIDADYYENPDNDGEIMFAFYNIGDKPIEIKKGEKIGQGLFVKYYKTHDDNVNDERTGGFGSTGD